MKPGKAVNRLQTLLLLLLLFALLTFSSCDSANKDSQSLHIPTEDTLDLLDTDPVTLDPALSQEIGSHNYIIQIFSGLVALDQDMNLVPDIAESWEIDESGKTYTFHLRQGVKFHNGKEVTAADFKYSWQRACLPRTGSPTAATYLSDIAGVEEVLSGESEEIEGVTVVNDYTLQVEIDNPKAYFPSKLTYPVAFVVDEANVESGQEWWKEPVGTGPFELMGWEEDEFLILKRNELFYRDKAGVSYIAFHFSGGTSMQLYETDEIDIAYVSLGNLERVLDETNPLHQELEIFPELSLSYIAFNTSRPPFNDPDVRQAFCLAVDKERIISQALKDAVSPASAIVPPGISGYDMEIQGLSYDPDMAKELLNGTVLPHLTFTTSGSSGSLSPWLTAILWQWQQNLGVEIEVRQLESDSYFPRLDEEKDDMFFYGWVADYPDPQNFLEILFGSDRENNKGEYKNPEVDDLLAQAAIEQDSQSRFELYREAEQKIIEDAACLPLWTGKDYVLIKPHVENYVISPLGIPLLSQVSLSD